MPTPPPPRANRATPAEPLKARRAKRRFSRLPVVAFCTVLIITVLYFGHRSFASMLSRDVDNPGVFQVVEAFVSAWIPDSWRSSTAAAAGATGEKRPSATRGADKSLASSADSTASAEKMARVDSAIPRQSNATLGVAEGRALAEVVSRQISSSSGSRTTSSAETPLPNAGGQNGWDGGGGNGLWSNNTNWGTDVQPAYGTLTFDDANNGQTTMTDDNITSMNQLLWTGTNSWTLNQGGATVLSLFDNGGVQAKIENQSTGLVTINLPIKFSNSNATNPFGEINAVNGGITFGTGTLTIDGTQVNGIKLFGSGQTVTFNNTVNASNATNGGNGNKWFGFTTTGAGNTVAIGGTFNVGDFYVMNGGTLRINSGGTLNSTAVRLGGDFGNTGNQDQTKSGTLQLASTTGGQTFGSIINTVTGNTSNALLIDSQNTSGTNTITGNIFLDSNLAVQQAAGGTLAITNATLDLKAQTLSLRGSGGLINITGVIGNSTGAGQLVVGTNGTAGSGGTVTLSNTNTYAGETFVRNGTLAFTSTGSSNNSVIRLGSNVNATAVNAEIDFVGITGGVSIASTINPVAPFTGGSGTLALNSLNLSGANTYSGHIGLDRAFTITQSSGGTLNITQARAGGAGTTTGADIKAQGLTLSAASGGTINFSGDIYNSTGAGGVTAVGGGLINYSGINTYTGTTTLGPGTIQLDNTAGNTGAGAATNRMADTAGFNFNGGTLSLLGNTANGSSETVGALALNSGSNVINVTNNGGAGTQLTFTDSGTLRDSTKMVVNFTGTGTGALGSSGNNPRVTFTGALFTNTTNGMLANSSSATAQTTGWAVVNGTSWAGVGANGIVALADTTRDSATLASAASWELTNFTPSTTVTNLGANLGTSATNSLGALKISPTAAGQSLAVGTNNIFATALMLTGSTDFTITGTTGGFQIGGGTRYVWVTDANTTLNYGAAFPSTGPINKAGAGILNLNGSSSQLPAANTNILDGVLRGTTTSLGGGTSAGGINTTINFRGGVLELSGGGSFARAIDLAGAAGGGGITFDSGSNDHGSGGFSAIGGAASFTLVTAIGGASSANLVWNDGLFVADGYALLFGSTKSDSQLTLTNNVGLDAGTVGAVNNAREIRVAAGVIGSSARISGNITGSTSSDLLKTGAGILELTGNNNFAGRTIVAQGTLTAGSAGALGSGTAGTSSVTVNTGGTLLLSNSGTTDHINNNAAIVLAGGTFNTGGVSEGTTGAAGVGALTLLSSSIIDLTGTSILHFAASGSQSWSGTLSIYNWTGSISGGGAEQLLFGTNDSATSLTQTQLNMINFYSGSGTGFLGTGSFAGLGDGEIVPIPEPSTWLGGILAAGALGLTQRRRLARLIKRAA